MDDTCLAAVVVLAGEYFCFCSNGEDSWELASANLVVFLPAGSSDDCKFCQFNSPRQLKEVQLECERGLN